MIQLSVECFRGLINGNTHANDDNDAFDDSRRRPESSQRHACPPKTDAFLLHLHLSIGSKQPHGRHAAR